jgi:cyclohexyl-isocyanide hydratase
MPFRAGLLLFPRLTQLDLTGPYEIFCRAPGFEVELIAKTRDPVRSDHGLTIQPTASFEEAGPLDLVCVPGGPGVNDLLGDVETLEFLRRGAREARYVTSVCTGSLILGAAGLLQGKKAACHWAALPYLSEFCATPVSERVVRDGNIITGGGVTAGIDFALTVVAEVCGEDAARAIQLMIEYAPAPPFDAGSPESAGEAIMAALRHRLEAQRQARQEAVRRAAARLREGLC